MLLLIITIHYKRKHCKHNAAQRKDCFHSLSRLHVIIVQLLQWSRRHALMRRGYNTDDCTRCGGVYNLWRIHIVWPAHYTIMSLFLLLFLFFSLYLVSWMTQQLDVFWTFAHSDSSRQRVSSLHQCHFMGSLRLFCATFKSTANQLRSCAPRLRCHELFLYQHKLFAARIKVMTTCVIVHTLSVRPNWCDIAFQYVPFSLRSWLPPGTLMHRVVIQLHLFRYKHILCVHPAGFIWCHKYFVLTWCCLPRLFTEVTQTILCWRHSHSSEGAMCTQFDLHQKQCYCMACAQIRRLYQ